jgi:cell division protein FtsB
MKNPDKTNGGEWVSAYECDPLTAAQEFAFARSQYAATTGRRQGASEVVGYHLRQSFAPGECDAATANRIGYGMAMSLTKGKFAFLVCTHVDKEHIHSHVLVSAVSLDCSRKFRNFKGSAFALRKISDLLCLENGLSVIENPKNSRGSYADWLGKKPPTAREQLCDLIDANLIVGQDMGALLVALKRAGCEIKIGKHTAVKLSGGKKFLRFDTIGGDYSEDALRERLSGKRNVAPRVKVDDDVERKAAEYEAKLKMQNRPNILIDIQAKIREGAGGAYQQWMMIFNLKQAARTLIFLQENGIDSYDDLRQKSRAASGEYNERSDRITVIEKQQKEISELQKQIGTYGKNRAAYTEYIKIKNPKKKTEFYEDNRAAIELCRAAKKYFDSLNLGGKLPPIASLKQEWATLDSERNSLFRGYKELREKYLTLCTAESNARHMLGITDDGRYVGRAEPLRTQKSHDYGAR